MGWTKSGVRVSASFQKIPPQGSSKKGAYDLGAVVRGVDLLPPVAQYNNNNNNNRVKKKIIIIIIIIN